MKRPEELLMEQVSLADFLKQAQKRFALPDNQGDFVEQLLLELEKVCSEAETLLVQQRAGDRSLIACAAGCAHCCVVNVSISVLEGLSILRFINQLDDKKREQISVRLDELWIKVRGLDDDERLAQRKKCAFLDHQGCCVIYPVRPLFCRSISSTDPEICRSAVTSKLYGDSQPLLMHQFQLQLYETLFFAVGEGLNQVGLDGRSFQLSGLVRYLLRNSGNEAELLTNASLTWNALYA
ncbi:MAG: YkgJ family cysteine cluster protein [Deltaproteobacteria bacterium]|nr:YkgJ family cysteine cluster protein [Deltaproteobacteria bacterium]MCW8893031.1 YkgJ family cysteine cluster protein [Deltaproteobacteria bacterium]MCW9050243.1 YkgJ family cysteine cluster protein [Deltaproteobacteria bacterium]